MNEENKMYEYLLEHNYISKNENKSPLRQQELSKERAECIANKYNSLVEEKTKVALANHKYASQCEDKVIVLQNNWNELNKFVEEEKNRLATGVSNTYEDNLGKRRFVNEDIFNELTKVSEKMQALENDNNE